MENVPDTAETQFTLNLLDKVPSHKFLPLVYQIASRLDLIDPDTHAPDRQFRIKIRDLLLRLVREHPYHTLNQLFALANGDQVSRVGLTVQGGAALKLKRIQAAKDLVAELKKDVRLKELVKAQEKLINKYIELGNQQAHEQLFVKNTPMGQMTKAELRLLPPPTLTVLAPPPVR